MIDNKNKFNLTFDKASLKVAISFLLDNYFFNFGNLPFLQIIRIPMESDPLPFVTKLFFHYYRNKWLLDTKKDIYIKHTPLEICFVS